MTSFILKYRETIHFYSISFLQYAIALLLAILLVLVGTSLYQSFVKEAAPATSVSYGYVTSYDKFTLHTVIRLTRHMDIRKIDTPIEISRSVSCLVGTANGNEIETHDFPPFVTYYEKLGVQKISRLLVYPKYLPKGTNCKLVETLRWLPFLAFHKSSERLPDIKFEVD